MGIRTVAPEFRVNSSDLEVHLDPAIATMPDGRFIVTWASEDVPVSIRARVIKADGDPIGDDIGILNVLSANPPDLTVLRGGYLVFGATDGAPMLAVATPDGRVFGSGQATPGTTGTTSDIAVATMANGGFVTAWKSQGREDLNDGSGSAIVGRVWSQSTEPLGLDFVLNSSGEGDQIDPAVAALSGGGFVAAWTSHADGPGRPGVVAMRLFAGDGAARTEDLTVTTRGDPRQVDVAGLGENRGYVVAWSDTRADEASIYARVYDGDSRARGPAFLVSDARSRDDSSPQVTMLDDGRFVVLWNDGDVKARLFDTTGLALGTEFRVSSDDAAPDVTALADGRFAVAWTESAAVVRAIVFDARSYRGTGAGDSWRGGDAKDTISGLGGNDLLYGLGGNDRLEGGRGADRLSGGDGHDVLDGGAGSDVLTGGAGSDRFRFAGVADARRDRINDFVAREDVIDLRALDAREDRTGDQAFSFLGSREFTGRSGQLRFEDGTLSGDTDGDGDANFSIRVVGVEALRAADLIT